MGTSPARGNTRIPSLRQLYSRFPGGWSGFALLVLRTAFGMALLYQGATCLADLRPRPFTSICGAAEIAAGLLLIIGFLTPAVGALTGAAGLAAALSLLPHCVADLFASRSSAGFAAAILLAIVVLGPGSLSVDNVVFGRREIIIPRRRNL